MQSNLLKLLFCTNPRILTLIYTTYYVFPLIKVYQGCPYWDGVVPYCSVNRFRNVAVSLNPTISATS